MEFGFHLIIDEVELSHPNAELRLPEVFQLQDRFFFPMKRLRTSMTNTGLGEKRRFVQVFPPNEQIESINDQYWTWNKEEARVSLYNWKEWVGGS